MSAITPQQEKFSQLVASGETYSDAYRKSYKVNPKCKIETVWVNSSQLMSDTKVSQRVKELQANIQKRNEVTLDEVLKELADWLRFDPIEFFDENNCIKNMHDLSPLARKQIADIRVQETWANMDGSKLKTGEIKNIKFLDKQSTVDKFMKFFGAYIENHKISVEDLSHVKDLLDSIGK